MQIRFALCLLFITSAFAEQCRLQISSNMLNDDPTIPTGTYTVGNSSATSTPTTSSASISSTPFQAFNYGKDPIRGVNLGGWFVLEPWITPSIFENTGNDDIVDEYRLGQFQTNDTTLEIMKNHWDTWITEDDFIAISNAGLTHVRLPLGYWSVPLTSSDTNQSTSTEPYIPGAWPYLLQALNWAHAHNIHVILDIHGAPGSQNGYDNSGQRTSSPQWGITPANITRTLDTVRFIVEQIGGMLDVIELVNESAGFTSDAWTAATQQYFQDGYNTVRDAVGNSIKVMIGDAFRGVDYWDGFLTSSTAQGVLMDYHEYQIFSIPELERTFAEHIQNACSLNSTLVDYANSNIWTIVGEWSNAPTDCTKWLNGRGIGARWDGTYSSDSAALGSCDGWSGSYSNFTDDYKTFLRQYWEVQVDIGESVQGWAFWTWKAENSDEWSYQKGLEGGWIPQDPSDRLYPSICS